MHRGRAAVSIPALALPVQRPEAGRKPVWKMRRLFALMLIATSGWLLYRTANSWLGGMDQLLTRQLAGYVDKPDFMVPAIGSVLGLLGGLTVFFGGPGGAMIALAGGVGVAGFALSLKQTLELNHFWTMNWRWASSC